MKIGIFLFPEARNPDDDGRLIKETVQEAVTAEQLGADAVFLAEHHFDGNCVYVDPPMFASHISALTSRIRIGFSVLQTSLYHPLRLAEQLSILDNLSNGRLIVGLGRGSAYNMHEYIGFQVAPESAQERFEELELILLQCWTKTPAEKVVHHGKYWNFEIPMLRPRTFTKPHPPLLRSVASRASLGAMARIGRPVMIGAQTTELAIEAVQFYRNAMREAGFSAEAVEQAVSQSWVARHVVMAPTDEEVELGMRQYNDMLLYRSNQSEKIQQRSAREKESLGVPRFTYGTPDKVIPEFKKIKQSGIGGVILRFRSGPMATEYSTRAMTLFMKEVLPAL